VVEDDDIDVILGSTLTEMRGDGERMADWYTHWYVWRSHSLKQRSSVSASMNTNSALRNMDEHNRLFVHWVYLILWPISNPEKAICVLVGAWTHTDWPLRCVHPELPPVTQNQYSRQTPEVQAYSRGKIQENDRLRK
jgi:hypothetical protein